MVNHDATYVPTRFIATSKLSVYRYALVDNDGEFTVTYVATSETFTDSLQISQIDGAQLLVFDSTRLPATVHPDGVNLVDNDVRDYVAAFNGF